MEDCSSENQAVSFRNVNFYNVEFQKNLKDGDFKRFQKIGASLYDAEETTSLNVVLSSQCVFFVSPCNCASKIEYILHIFNLINGHYTG